MSEEVSLYTHTSPPPPPPTYRFFTLVGAISRCSHGPPIFTALFLSTAILCNYLGMRRDGRLDGLPGSFPFVLLQWGQAGGKALASMGVSLAEIGTGCPVM